MRLGGRRPRRQEQKWHVPLVDVVDRVVDAARPRPGDGQLTWPAARNIGGFRVGGVPSSWQGFEEATNPSAITATPTIGGRV